jgi:protein-arginine deiminase
MAAAKPARSPAAVRWLGLWLALAAASLGRAESPVAEEVVLLANRDDDDRDGVADADDDRVNGPADGDDLAVVRLAAPPGTRRLRIAADDAPLRFFARDGGGWRHLGRGAGELAVPAAAAEEGIDLGIEAIAWAGLPAEWTGRATIRVAFEGSDAAPRELAVRVAPVVLLPATAPVAEVYVATGRYDNAGFIAALEGVLEPLAVPLRTHAARDWKEMWMQDTMEIGIATTPRASMHVVLAGLRNADSFPPTLLGPDVAVVAAATFRPLGGGDAWADWYGNLEASVPTAAHPRGRVIHGRNRLTGTGFHPDAVRFLAAQGAQPPVWIDTSWLLIKHVDEIVSFLPGTDGGGVILVPDPDLGMRLLGDDPDLPQPVADRRREANRRIARELEALLGGGAAVTMVPARRACSACWGSTRAGWCGCRSRSTCRRRGCFPMAA